MKKKNKQLNVIKLLMDMKDLLVLIVFSVMVYRLD